MKNGETRTIDRIQGLENPKRGKRDKRDKRKVFESKGRYYVPYVPLCTFLKKEGMVSFI